MKANLVQGFCPRIEPSVLSVLFILQGNKLDSSNYSSLLHTKVIWYLLCMYKLLFSLGFKHGEQAGSCSGRTWGRQSSKHGPEHCPLLLSVLKAVSRQATCWPSAPPCCRRCSKKLPQLLRMLQAVKWYTRGRMFHLQCFSLVAFSPGQ